MGASVAPPLTAAGYDTPFDDAARWLCGDSPSLPCLLQSFATFPIAVAFLWIAAFLIEAPSPVLASSRPFARVRPWPWALTLACSGVELVVGVARVALAVRPDAALARGEALAAYATVVAWALHTAAAARRWRTRRPLGDYLLAWWSLAAAADVAGAAVEVRGWLDDGGRPAGESGVTVLALAKAAAGAPLLALACVALCWLRDPDRGAPRPKGPTAATPLLAAASAAARSREDGGVPADSSGGAAPYDRANLLSRITFWWLQPLMVTGHKRPLEAADLPELAWDDAAPQVSARFERAWAAEAAAPGGGAPTAARAGAGGARADAETRSLLSGGGATEPAVPTRRRRLTHALASAFGGTLAHALLFKLTFDVVQFTGPVLLSGIITYLADAGAGRGPPVWLGYAYTALLLGTSLLQTALLHQYFFRSFRVGQHMRSAIVLAVYRKTLRTSLGARGGGAGTVTNIMSTDAKRLCDLTSYLLTVVSGPFQIVLAVTLLYQQVGASVFAGVGVMVLFLPLNGFIARWSKGLQTALMKDKDERVSLTNEALGGIRLVKWNAWEPAFEASIGAVRARELRKLNAYMLVQQVSNVLWTGLPLLVMLATFGAYALANGGPPPAAALFTAVSLFSLLRFPMSMLPAVINAVVEAQVSVRRIEDFLNAEEVAPDAVLHLPPVGAADDGGGGGSAAPVDVGGAWGAATGEDGDGVHHNGDAAAAAAAARAPLPAPPPRVAMCVSRGTFRWAAAPAAAAAPAPHAGRSCCRRRLPPPAPVPDSDVPVRASFVLSDIDVAVAAGTLVAVVGGVGAGKTSLCHALLGELRREGGAVALRGSLAYVPQQPFIRSASVRDNITFGRPFDAARYDAALDACALRPDLDALPAGDATEVGERGIALSGGQRARVALARAVYADADCYVFDDTLSAVDAHVGAHIFSAVLGPGGLLAGRARLLVTHGLQYARLADEILVMAGGRIIERGSYDALVTRRGGPALCALMATFDTEATETLRAATAGGDAAAAAAGAGAGPRVKTANGAAGGATSPRPAPPPAVSPLAASDSGGSDDDEDDDGGAGGARTPAVGAPASAAAAATATAASRSGAAAPSPRLRPRGGGVVGAILALTSGKQTTIETRERGRVRLAVYAAYARALGGYGVTAGILVLFAGYQAASIGTSAYLSYWSTAAGGESGGDSNARRLGEYAAYSAGTLVVLIVLRVAVSLAGIRASRVLHDALLATLLRAPLSFVDTTPLGRLLNRCSQDVYIVDEQLPGTFSSFLSTLLSVVGTVALIGAVTPWFLLGAAPLFVVYAGLQRYYVATSRELQRLDSVSRSPLLTNFGETVAGIVTVRAFGQAERFAHANEAALDANQRAYAANQAANRWLAVRVETIGAALVSASAFFAVLQVTAGGGGGDAFAALAGLSIATALSTTQTLNWLVRMLSDAETQVVAVERLREYADMPRERDADGAVEPPPGWPSAGRVSIRGLRLRYRHTTPWVLRGMDAEIRGGEKVGVAGRTGAGKSSLVTALLATADVQDGVIEIDGVDIARVPKAALRARLTLIPQDPVLFKGNLRKNLDVLGGQYADDSLWAALRAVSMADTVAAMPGGLDADVLEGGANFSAGQRQLLTVARALLRHSKVTLIDEASSSVDVEADAALQRAIRTQFADSTVLTIAHRVHTILDSDRVMVLRDGRVAEFATPAALLADPGSEFGKLVRESQRGAEGGDDVGRTPPPAAAARPSSKMSTKAKGGR